MKGFRDGLLEERAYALTVNGRSIATVTMQAGLEKEFAYGYLLSEGIVQPSEIESVMVDGTDIGVLTRDTTKVLLPKKTVISGCGGTASYLDPEKLPVLEKTIEPPAVSFVFDSETVQLGGFSAAVVSSGKVVSADDIGQTAAIDKAFGKAILAGVDLSASALALSGKVTADMVRKALHAGVSVIFAKYPATSLAKETAEKTKLKIVKLYKYVTWLVCAFIHRDEDIISSFLVDVNHFLYSFCFSRYVVSYPVS